MFESTKMPNAWVKFLNDNCDGIIVPTQHCKDIFRLSGVKRPIKVVTLGVDSNEFKYIKPKEHDGYTFLWQGHHYDPEGRKNAGAVERAFREIRDNREIENCKLILKYRPHKNFQLKISTVETEPGIIHISDTISREEMNDLIATTDCCVNPSRGEGFGYIPLEQLACGLPTIVTNWSFPYTNEIGCIPVDYDLKPSPTKWCYKHIAISGIGIEYNIGKQFILRRFPSRIQRVSNGCIEVGINGKQTYVNKKWYKTIWNIIADLHNKSGLYSNIKRQGRLEYVFESTGLDAEVNINSLKNTMIAVYNNREIYKEMGNKISKNILGKYSIDRIKTELIKAISEFKNEGVV